MALLGIDLGAESGRALSGRFDGERLRFDVIHRWPNVPITTADGYFWDFSALSRNVLDAISLATRSDRVDGIGIDTWAVDFGLIDRNGTLLQPPHHHRDSRFPAALSRLGQRIPPRKFYDRTGIQILPINTSCQLLALRESKPDLVDRAHRLLLMPDLLRHELTGDICAEVTNASTTQLLSTGEPVWDRTIIDAIGVDPALFPSVAEPGSRQSPLREDVRRDGGIAGSPLVIAVASHDTASAVAAVPAEARSFGYISSGTWSLVGVERRQATINDAAFAANLTNERGVDGTFRLLKNVIGMWPLQECRRAWQRARGPSGAVEYDALIRLAELARPFGPAFDATDERLLHPDDMPGLIARLCRETGTAPSETRGEVVRAILESLACAYADAFSEIVAATGDSISIVHIVGGGSRNRLLCQMTADACQVPVVAGPTEATAIGNLLVQARAFGQLGTVADLREVVRRSFKIEEYLPDTTSSTSDRWLELRDRVATARRRSATHHEARTSQEHARS